MCIQTKRDTATDITKLLMNTEELMVVIHNEVLPSGQQLDSNMLEAIPEEEDAPSSDDSLLNEEDHRQPQHHPQLQQPPSSSSSSPATPIEHRPRHDKDRRKHTNGQTSNHPVDQTQGTSKFNLMRSFIMAAILTMIAMLLIAVTIQNEKQNIVRREAHEFHQSAREAIRQAEQRRDMRRERWG